MSEPAPVSGRAFEVVGRESERGRIDAFVSGLAGGARALLISGEAGIGKTALWRHGVERCRGKGFRVLVARPAEEEMPLALVGLVDLFDGLGVDEGPFRSADPFLRGRSTLEELRALAEEHPVVLAIDDLQWLDAVSARALRYALRRFDAEPIGVLGTIRDHDRGRDPLGLDTLLPPGRTDSLELGPLDLGTLRAVLAVIVDSISRPVLRRIHETSGGNPLYAIELARGLSPTGRAPRGRRRVEAPSSLPIRSRVGPVGGRGRQPTSSGLIGRCLVPDVGRRTIRPVRHGVGELASPIPGGGSPNPSGG